MSRVNLWQLINTVSSGDYSDSPNCKEILAEYGQRFATELSLEITTIDNNSVWTVTLFDHNDHNKHIELQVLPNGSIQLTRAMNIGGEVYETRKLSF